MRATRPGPVIRHVQRGSKRTDGPASCGTVLDAARASRRRDVPLSVAGVPWFARRVEQTLRDVPRGVVEAGRAMGGSELQVVLHVVLVEARPGLVFALAALVVSVLSYATVAGIMGGGGIGEFVLRYGYERFDADIMVFTVALLAALVQVIQLTGTRWARRVDKR